MYLKYGEVIVMSRVTQQDEKGKNNTSALQVMEIMRMLIEVIEEAVSGGLEKIRDHFHSVTLLLDLLLDYGLPLLSSKPFLVTFLKQSNESFLGKASTLATGSLQDCQSQMLSQALLSLNQSGDSSLWRWNTSSTYSNSGSIMVPGQSQTANTTSLEQLSSALIKDVYVDLNEYMEGIIRYN